MMRVFGKTPSLAVVAASLLVMSWGTARADYIAYSGTTVGGATFNRPLDNALNAPTALSGVGTAVSYQAQTFVVGAAGIYDILSVASYDNYTTLYQGAFNPASPLTNAVFANDDSNGIVGISGLLGISLAAGQSYTLVTSGFANTDSGTFSNTIAQQSFLESGTTTGGPTFDPFGLGEAIPYSTLAFSVSISGSYSFTSTAGFDNISVLYENAFNPNDVIANLIDFNDDYFAVGRTGLPAESLIAGTTYFLVTSGFDEASFGAFQNSISGPGVAIFPSTAVPEPSSLVLVGSGLILAFGVSRRRRATA